MQVYAINFLGLKKNKSIYHPLRLAGGGALGFLNGTFLCLFFANARISCIPYRGEGMIHLCDGNSEIGAHGGSNIQHLICLRHL